MRRTSVVRSQLLSRACSCLELVVTTLFTASRAHLRRGGPDGPGREQRERARTVERERAARVTRRRRPGFTRVPPLRGGSFRRVLRTQALRRGELPRTAPPVTGCLRSPPYPLPRPPAPRPGRQHRAKCADRRKDVIATGPERRALSGLAPPTSTMLRIPLRGTRLRRAVDPGDLCQPSGPDGEGQARGQARNARGEPVYREAYRCFLSDVRADM